MGSCRVRFLHELAQDEIRSICNYITECYLSITKSSLLLICDDLVYSFPIAYNPVLIKVAERGYEVYFDGVDRISWDGFVECTEEQSAFSYNDQECPICYESLKAASSMVALCGHGVCMRCLNKMADKNMVTCPICRSYSFKWLIGYVKGSALCGDRTRDLGVC